MSESDSCVMAASRMTARPALAGCSYAPFPRLLWPCIARRQFSQHTGSTDHWLHASLCREGLRISRLVAARAEPANEEYDPEYDALERMDKAIKSCEQELLGIRTGTPSTDLPNNSEMQLMHMRRPLTMMMRSHSHAQALERPFQSPYCIYSPSYDWLGVHGGSGKRASL